MLDPLNRATRSGDIPKFFQLGVNINYGSSAWFRVYDPVNYIHSRANSNRATLERRPLKGCFAVVQLEEWLRSCEASHQHNKDSYAQRPSSLTSLISQRRFKVVDVFSGAVVAVSKPERYLALSYVCGNATDQYVAKRHQAEAATSDAVKGSKVIPSVDFDSSPLTIRDAAALVRGIGERYLWVDCLCIDQFNVEEKAAVIARMDAIYTNSWFTIIAAGGLDAEAGLQRMRDRPERGEVPLEVASQAGSITFLPPRATLSDQLRRAKWTSRAWTYQERLLSARCVIFTETEVFFTCEAVLRTEGYDLVYHDAQGSIQAKPTRRRDNTKLLRLADRLTGDQDLGFDAYDEAVRTYTKKDLTKIGDRTDAFLGILNRFHHVRGAESDGEARHRLALSGLPLRWFGAALLWDWYGEVSPTRIEFIAIGTRHIPSWSWTGWSGPIFYDFNAVGDKSDLPGTTAVAIDEANILLEAGAGIRTSHPDPQLCEASRPGAVTIHMFTKSIPCHLTRSSLQRKYLGETEKDDTFVVGYDVHVALTESHNSFWDRFHNVCPEGAIAADRRRLDASLRDGTPSLRLAKNVAIRIPFADLDQIEWVVFDDDLTSGLSGLLVRRCGNGNMVERIGAMLPRILLHPTLHQQQESMRGQRVESNNAVFLGQLWQDTYVQLQ
ncbi:hypothetical protein LTR36_009976 [Oleoguttula mirabilis]|uniref:Heterokaryon incompatibility domain-containing protein n=1 Tax=Oleoguttula mirabilis TaxID=1507867 RepID=A0AAV9J5K1_9PEZI|nr:hypothetical protein LTR36_009976 [Oleoguttula mirabilis]